MLSVLRVQFFEHS